ncbi:JlpA family lipoprotein adhesin [Campylobacter aviculae]|nr:JlpA family lipoprotein adhesin [Campylobacter aviculae]
MKKYIVLFLSVIFFFACNDNSLDKNIAKKYKNNLNSQIQDTLKDMQEEFEIKIEFHDFQCQSNDNFVKCTSPNLEIFSKNNKKLLKIKSIELSSNEVYTGDKKGLISIKDLQEFLFSKNKQLQSKITFKDLKLSNEMIDEIKKIPLNKNPKINNYLYELAANPYTISFENLNSEKDNSHYNDILNISIQNNNKLDFNLNLNIAYKSKLLDILDSIGLKYNTDSLSTEEISDNNTDLNFAFSQIQENIIIQNIKLASSLDTKGVFENYIEVAKSMLNLSKEQSQKEDQVLIFDKTLKTFEKITQNPIYKLDIEMFFKNISLDAYSQEKEKAIEKLTINGEDFTEIIPIISNAILNNLLYDFY